MNQKRILKILINYIKNEENLISNENIKKEEKEEKNIKEEKGIKRDKFAIEGNLKKSDLDFESDEEDD